MIFTYIEYGLNQPETNSSKSQSFMIFFKTEYHNEMAITPIDPPPL